MEMGEKMAREKMAMEQLGKTPAESAQTPSHPATAAAAFTVETAPAERVDETNENGEDKEGGMDLRADLPVAMSLIGDRRRLLEHVIRVMGKEEVMRSRSPRLAGCTLEELKAILLTQLMRMSDKQIYKILQRKDELFGSPEDTTGEPTSESMDSTTEDPVSCTQPGDELDNELTSATTGIAEGGGAGGEAAPLPSCCLVHNSLELDLRIRAMELLMKANDRLSFIITEMLLIIERLTSNSSSPTTHS